MKHAREISALLTLLIAAAISLLLIQCHLSWNSDKAWPPQPDPYIELAQVEEFIEPQLIPIPVSSEDLLDAAAKLPEDINVPSEAAPESGTSLRNEGPKADAAKTTTTTKTSSVQTKAQEQPAKTGATADNAKAEADATAAHTRNNVKNAFAKSESKNNANNLTGDEGKSGSTKGKDDSAGPADSNSLTSGVQHGKVSGGWIWPTYSVRIRSSVTGSIVLRLVIDKNGNVTEAHPSGGQAPAASDVRLQQQCIAVAKSRSFTRSDQAGAAPDRSTATLTFTFK